eukprot:7381712-Prymnesium_polylepis.1
MAAELFFERAAVKGSVNVSFVNGPTGIPESKAMVHGDNGTVAVSNFMFPYLKRGNSIVIRADAGSVVRRDREPSRTSTFEYQMEAFTSRVRDVSAGRASATGFANTGSYLLRFMGVLDA